MQDSLKYDLAEDLFKNDLISIEKEDGDELYEQKLKLIKHFINSVAGYWNRGGIWNRERLVKLISYINSELKANNKNFYELNELDSNLGVKPESIFIKDMLYESNHLSYIIDKINNDKIKSIIDIVKNQQYLTKELFANIDSHFNSIKTYLYNKIKTLLIEEVGVP
jgi:REP element-mobilizing transposase RayT